MEFILSHENVQFYFLIFQLISISWKSFCILRSTSFVFTAAGYFVYEYSVNDVTSIQISSSLYFQRINSTLKKKNRCCCSVTQLCLTLCNPMDYSMPGSLFFTISRSLLKLMSIEFVMPSSHLFLCCPLSFCLQPFPSSGSFPMSQLFASGSPSIGVASSASVLPVNIQG